MLGESIKQLPAAGQQQHVVQSVPLNFECATRPHAVHNMEIVFWIWKLQCYVKVLLQAVRPYAQKRCEEKVMKKMMI
jgi:hypothetical protein